MYPLVGSISVESQIRSQLEVKSRDPLWAQTGLEVGKLVAGYRVVRPLTDRALGASALVCHEKTGRALELKLPPAGLAATAEGRARLERDIERLAELRHPNVARYVDHGVLADGRPYVCLLYTSPSPRD